MSKKTIKTLVVWGIIIAIVVTAIVLLITVVNKKEELPTYQIEGTTLVQYNGKEENVVIPKEVKLVGKAAFKNNTAIKTVKFESGSKAEKIAMNAFEGCAALEEIYFPETMEELGDNAFLDCVGIKILTLTDNIKSIGKSTFQGCINLVDITLNEGLEKIGNNAFQDCLALMIFSIPSTLNSFGNDVFKGALGLENIYVAEGNETYNVVENILYTDGGKEIVVAALTTAKDLVINNNVKVIRSNAFYNADSIKTLVVPTSVEKIGAEAFSGCKTLEKITVPFIGEEKDGNTRFASIFGTVAETLTEVEVTQGTKVIAKAFSGLNKIESIKLPNTITYVGEASFENCSSLKLVYNLPNNLSIIRDNTFNGCTNLSSKVINNLINNNLEVIGKSAFAGCEALTSIAIPESVKHIGIGAFAGCKKIESIKVPFIGMGYEYFNNPNGGTSIGTTLTTNKLFGYIFSSTEITDNLNVLPTTLKTVEITGNYDVPEKAFINCTTLQTIKLNNEVKKINAQALKGCSGLVTFELPTNVENIGTSAFEGCKSLETIVNFPAKITTINDNLFYDCEKLLNIEISENILKIGKYAFYNCNAIINISANNPNFELYQNSLYTKGLEKLLRYQASTAGESSFTILPQTKVIAEGAFLNVTELKEIVVPATVVEIQQYAIVGCSNIEKLVLPFIGNFGEEYAESNGIARNDSFDCIFAGAKPSKLSLTISNGETIGNGAFSNNSYIIEITLSDTFTRIEASAFEKCSALEQVNFGTETHPAQITYVGDRAFSGCGKLESIALADTIEEIGSYAFAECSKIKSITLPKNLMTLGEGVFMNCSSLYQINLSDENTHYNVVDNGTTLISEDGKSLVVYTAGPQLLGQIKLTDQMVQLFIDGAYYYALDENVYSSYELSTIVGSHNSKNREVSINSVTYKYDTKGNVNDAEGNVVEGAKADNRFRVLSNTTNTYYISGSNLYSDEAKTTEVGSFKNNTSFTVNDVTYLYDTEDFWYYKEEYKDYVLDQNIINLYPYAFSGVRQLKNIKLHDNVQSIGDGLFYNCEALESVTLPTNITSINSKMFENCSSLTTVINISNVETIEAFAFRNCAVYNDETIFANLNEIAQFAFEGCTSLSKVTLNESIESIANGTFKDCENLSEVVYSSKIKTIGDYAFLNCSKLATYVLPAELESIGREAFSGATDHSSLASKDIIILFPEKLTSIGFRAFYRANRIDIVYIPENVTTIADGAMDIGANTHLFTDAITFTETTNEDGVLTKTYIYPSGWEAFSSIPCIKYAKGEYETKDGIPVIPVKEEEETSK